MSITLSTAPLADQIDALHAAVRWWTGHFPQNLPYIDLLFAFAYAELGESSRAARLVEAARTVMEVPVPAPTGQSHPNQQSFEAATSAVVTNFLFKAFKYRIDQATAGQRHGGPLSRELLDDLDDIRRRAKRGPPQNSLTLADYFIGRMRGWSRILEPHERPDVYIRWTKTLDQFKRELSSLEEIRDSDQLAAEIRRLHAEGSRKKGGEDVQLQVLREGLWLAPRVGESFVLELLRLVPTALAELPTGSSFRLLGDIFIRGDVLERALVLAGFYGRSEIVTTLADQFIDLAVRSPEDSRLRLMNVIGATALRIMKQLGLRHSIDRFCTRLQQEVLCGASPDELRDKYGSRPEEWATVLITELNIAGGYLVLGTNELAARILDEARKELLGPQAVRFPAKEYTALAQAYVATLGHGPAGTALARITELFREMDPRRITNTFTTAQYFSRFHMNLVEEVVVVLRGWRNDHSALVQS